MTMVDTDTWRADARCRLHPKVNFFPVDRSDVPAAVAICMKCPVAKQCYEDAQSTPWRSVGVWGGTTAKQRIMIRDGRRPLPAWLR